MNRRNALLLVACLLTALPRPAGAQDFPAGKPIRILVGLAAGGATDVMARLVAAKMSENLGTTVFVENKAGGNFIPALRELTSAPADGHTLFFISTSTLITQPLHPDYPFDLTKLTPVTQVATGPLIVVVRNGLGIKTLGELIDHARANPSKLSFGAGGGTGSSLYFATELLKAKTGIKLTIVNYRGAGPALNDLLGGHIDGMFDAMPVMVVQAKEGKVTPLAVTSAKRSPALPNVPTMEEAGLKGYEVYEWNPVLAPAGISADTRRQLVAAVQRAMAASEVQERIRTLGGEAFAGGPDAAAKFLKEQQELWGRVVRERNIKAE